MTAPEVRARRGMVCVVECEARRYRVGRSVEVAPEFSVCVVASVTREGQVKAVRDFYAGQDWPMPLARIVGLRRVHLAPDVDATGARAAADANHYPGHSGQRRPFASLPEVVAALRPHRTAQH